MAVEVVAKLISTACSPRTSRIHRKLIMTTNPFITDEGILARTPSIQTVDWTFSMIFWTEAPECMARNFGFCSSTASLTNFTGWIYELTTTSCSAFRADIRCWYYVTTSNVNIQNIKAFQTSANSLTSWSTAGRSSALVELSLVIPCHTTNEPFTSKQFYRIIRHPFPAPPLLASHPIFLDIFSSFFPASEMATLGK